MTKQRLHLKDFYRDVRTGQFVTERQHENRPNTTEHERRFIPSPQPEHHRHPTKPKR